MNRLIDWCVPSAAFYELCVDQLTRFHHEWSEAWDIIQAAVVVVSNALREMSERVA